MATGFQLLGEIEVRVNGGVVDVGHSRQRCVLAVLLVEAMHCFGDLVGQARGSDDARAVALLERALGLWRGDPVADLDTAWINSVRSILAAQRHTAQLDLADAQLRLGQHAAVVALRLLHQQVLRSHPVLSAGPATPSQAASPEVPRQLPVGVVGFTGRGRYLAELDRLLTGIAGDPGDRQGLVRA